MRRPRSLRSPELETWVNPTPKGTGPEVLRQTTGTSRCIGNFVEGDGVPSGQTYKHSARPEKTFRRSLTVPPAGTRASGA